MTVNTETERALAAIDRHRADWDATVEAIGLDRMEEPGMMGDWTPKDTIAHIMGWRRKTISSLAATIAGEDKIPTPWPESLNDPENPEEDGDFEAINDWIHMHYLERPAADAIAEANATWDELQSMIAELPPTALVDASFWRRLEGVSILDAIESGYLFEHFREHFEDDVEPWIEAHGRHSG